MRKSIISFILLLGFVLFQSSVFAQENNDTAKTLIGDKTPINTKDLGFFIAPAYSLTKMDGSSTSLFNLRAGLNIKDKFTIGGFFNTSINEINPKSETIPNVYMDYWSAGGLAEYTIFSKKVVHFTFPLYVGYGEVQMDNENGDPNLGESNFFQIEPSALIEVNLHKHIRLNFGVGYRMVSQMNYRNFDQSNISGLNTYAGLKFGLFK